MANLTRIWLRISVLHHLKSLQRFRTIVAMNHYVMLVLSLVKALSYRISMKAPKGA